MSRSKDAISASLLVLLKKDSFHVVTISEICAHGNVARRTFYNNFKTKEDIIEYVVDKLVIEYIDSIKNQQLNTPRTMGRAYYKFWLEKKDVVSVLEKNNLFYILQKEFLNYLPELATAMGVDEIAALMDETLLDYLYTFVSSGLCYNLEKWAKNDYRESYDEVGEVFNVIANGLID